MIPAKDRIIENLTARSNALEKELRDLIATRYVVSTSEVRSWDEEKMSTVELSLFKGVQTINMERGRRESLPSSIQMPASLGKDADPIDSQTTCEAVCSVVGLEP